MVAHAADKDLLILGMRQEPWLTSFFFGTIAEQVARAGAVSLVADEGTLDTEEAAEAVAAAVAPGPVRGPVSR